MIQINNLSKYYGDLLAVNDLNFTVNDGEILGFFGAERRRKDNDAENADMFHAAVIGDDYIQRSRCPRAFHADPRKDRVSS